MSIAKSLKVQQGYPHRIHRPKKSRRPKYPEHANLRAYREKKRKLAEPELSLDDLSA